MNASLGEPQAIVSTRLVFTTTMTRMKTRVWAVLPVDFWDGEMTNWTGFSQVEAVGIAGLGTECIMVRQAQAVGQEA